MTREQQIYRLAYWLACFIIAGTFLSGYHKLLYPGDFALAVYRFHLLPGWLVNPVALYLPWLETACALCLLFFPRYRAAAMWIVLVLLLGFTLAIGINLWRGSAFGCGCFGRGESEAPLNWLALLRNLALICLLLLAQVSRRKME